MKLFSFKASKILFAGIGALAISTVASAQGALAHMDIVTGVTNFSPIFPYSFTGNLYFVPSWAPTQKYGPGNVTGFVSQQFSMLTIPGFNYTSSEYVTEHAVVGGVDHKMNIYYAPGDAQMIESILYPNGTNACQLGFSDGIGTTAVASYSGGTFTQYGPVYHSANISLPTGGGVVWYYYHTPNTVSSINWSDPAVTTYALQHLFMTPWG